MRSILACAGTGMALEGPNCSELCPDTSILRYSPIQIIQPTAFYHMLTAHTRLLIRGASLGASRFLRSDAHLGRKLGMGDDKRRLYSQTELRLSLQVNDFQDLRFKSIWSFLSAAAERLRSAIPHY